MVEAAETGGEGGMEGALTDGGVMGEAQTMREKGEVWGLRVI
jgi:hypothetical protein